MNVEAVVTSRLGQRLLPHRNALELALFPARRRQIASGPSRKEAEVKFARPCQPTNSWKVLQGDPRGSVTAMLFPDRPDQGTFPLNVPAGKTAAPRRSKAGAEEY
jgi:hypothetical protein